MNTPNTPEEALAPFTNISIDWDMTPEMAVTLYLEWGNNNWHASHPPVRSKSDVVFYFIISSWEQPLTVRLVERNSEQATDLVVFQLPDDMAEIFTTEYGKLKGIFEPLPSIKAWLREIMEGS